MGQRIRWNPVVNREKIRRLYRSERTCIIDEGVLDDVGIALLLRCESILMVSSNRVACPECGAAFELSAISHSRREDDRYDCVVDDCTWAVTWGEYHKSWSNRRLYGGNAIPAFSEYIRAYSSAKTTSAKMIAIDQLIHAFHIDLKTNLPNRLAADNLIDGNHAQVLALLEDISGAAPSKTLSQTSSDWKDTVARMKQRRSGKES